MYKSIRIQSEQPKNQHRQENYIPFSDKNRDFLLLSPRIQLCVFEREALELPVKIVYPS